MQIKDSFNKVLNLKSSESSSMEFIDSESFEQLFTSVITSIGTSELINKIEELINLVFSKLSDISLLKKEWRDGDLIDQLSLDNLQKSAHNLSLFSIYGFYLCLFLFVLLDEGRFFESLEESDLLPSEIGSREPDGYVQEGEIKYPSASLLENGDPITEYFNLEHIYLPMADINGDYSMLPLLKDYDSLSSRFFLTTSASYYLVGKGVPGFFFKINSDNTSGNNLYSLYNPHNTKERYLSTKIDHEKHKYLGVIFQLRAEDKYYYIDIKLEWNSETESYAGTKFDTHPVGHANIFTMNATMVDNTIGFSLEFKPGFSLSTEEDYPPFYGSWAVVYPLDDICFTLTEYPEGIHSCLGLKDLKYPLFRNVDSNSPFVTFPNLYISYLTDSNFPRLHNLVENIREEEEVQIKYTRVSINY